jgi:uncharacterized phage infection (PIP) family protein YhgE
LLERQRSIPPLPEDVPPEVRKQHEQLTQKLNNLLTTDLPGLTTSREKIETATRVQTIQSELHSMIEQLEKLNKGLNSYNSGFKRWLADTSLGKFLHMKPTDTNHVLTSQQKIQKALLDARQTLKEAVKSSEHIEKALSELKKELQQKTTEITQTLKEKTSYKL